jgi:hypothetical protein
MLFDDGNYLSTRELIKFVQSASVSQFLSDYAAVRYLKSLIEKESVSGIQLPKCDP